MSGGQQQGVDTPTLAWHTQAPTWREEANRGDLRRMARLSGMALVGAIGIVASVVVAVLVALPLVMAVLMSCVGATQVIASRMAMLGGALAVPVLMRVCRLDSQKRCRRRRQRTHVVTQSSGTRALRNVPHRGPSRAHARVRKR